MRFNSKIDILSITETTDSAGGHTEIEVELYRDLACRINWTKGSEKVVSDKTTYYRDAKVFCRVKGDITTKHRVKYNGTTYQIVDVRNVDEANRLMVLDIKLIV